MRLIDADDVLSIVDDLRDQMTVEGYWSMIERVKGLKETQPKHTEERTETRACDLVSRQAVTDTVRKIILGFFSDEDGVMTDTEKTLLSVNKSICDGVRELPSAQPEIIRCKDCKWCKDADGLMCKNPASWVVATECDFGCVLAERRSDG